MFLYHRRLDFLSATWTECSFRLGDFPGGRRVTIFIARNMSAVKSALDLSPKKLKNLKEALNKPGHATPAALRKLGIGYVVRGAGRGSKSFLIKDQAA